MLRVQPVIHPGQQWRTLFWLYHPPSNDSIMWCHWKMLPKQLKHWITERYSHRGTFRTQEVKEAKGLQNLCAAVKLDSCRSFKTCSRWKTYTAHHKTSECTFVCMAAMNSGDGAHSIISLHLWGVDLSWMADYSLPVLLSSPHEAYAAFSSTYCSSLACLCVCVYVGECVCISMEWKHLTLVIMAFRHMTGKISIHSG